MNQLKKLNEANYASRYFVDELVRRLVVQKNIYMHKFDERSLSISRGDKKMESSFED